MRRLILTSTLASVALFAATATAATRTDMLVTTEWLAGHLNDANLVIVQVGQNRNGYDAGHIPGAHFVALPDLVMTRDGISNELRPVAELQAAFEAAGVSNGSRVILYAEGTVLPATRAYFTLDYLGLGDQTALLDGGFDKWKAESRTTSTAAAASARGQITPQVREQVVAKVDQVKNFSSQLAASNQAPAIPTLLDVRVAGDFSGGERAGHIPGAVNVYWMDHQAAADNTTLRPESDLRALYAAAGIAPGQRVVTYCNSGMQASESYFTLKYLGYDVQMFDGSLSEWSKTPGTSVVQ